MEKNSILNKTKKILVIRLDVLGDLILSTPFFRNLHENFKNASVVALVREYTAGALKNNPNIDEILVYPEKASLGEKLKFISELRKRKFDFSISLSPITKSYLLSFLITGRKSFSYVYSGRFITELFAKLLIGNLPKLDINGMLASGQKVPHEVVQTFTILKSLGIDPVEYPLEIFVEEDSFKRADNILKEKNFTEKNIGLHLSAKWLTCDWTVENLADIVKNIAKKFADYGIILTYGIGSEADIAEKIKKYLSDIDDRVLILGGMNFSDWAGVVSKCKVFVSTDTGALHCATALKIPVVAVYESSTYDHCSEQWKPWMVEFKSIKKETPSEVSELAVSYIDFLLKSKEG